MYSHFNGKTRFGQVISNSFGVFGRNSQIPAHPGKELYFLFARMSYMMWNGWRALAEQISPCLFIKLNRMDPEGFLQFRIQLLIFLFQD